MCAVAVRGVRVPALAGAGAVIEIRELDEPLMLFSRPGLWDHTGSLVVTPHRDHDGLVKEVEETDEVKRV